MSVPTDFVSRADLGWGPSEADYADPKSGLTVHYNGAATNLATESDCSAYWQGVRSDHMTNRSWADIGYSFGVGVGGRIYEGRGLRRYQAAQGTTAGNANYYSVSLMIGEGETPTDAQIDGVRRLRTWLMTETGMAPEVLGHRDFIQTSCPGSILYGMVQDGTFTGEGDFIMAYGIIDLSMGDSGRAVAALQRLLLDCGVPNLLPTYGVDSDYGQETSDAVLAVRQSMGSTATDGDTITSYAFQQIMRAHAREQARLVFEELYSGGSSTSLPAEETVNVTSGQITITR